MNNNLEIGLKTTKKIKVDNRRTIGFMGEEGRVYSTPSMVEDIEYTCHEFLQQYLEEDENTVGTHISVDHLGPTVEGDTVEITISLIGIEGQAIFMDAVVKDSLEEVGRGKHNRFVVDMNKTFERLKSKRDKVFGP